MKSILFLNKALVNTETHYWSTELEITDLIWLVQKICHMLKSAEKLTIVYTDHSVTLSMVCQFSLTSTTFINKMNLQLVHISEYLQRFCLNIQHKAGKINIVSDTLSWLASTSTSDSLNQSLDSLTVDTLMVEIWSWLADWTAQLRLKKDTFKDTLLTECASVYSATLVELNEAFWIRLLEVYNTESQWDCIQIIISDNDTLGENTVKLSYCLVWKLIYFDNSEQSLCLCIFTDLIKEVFQLTHNELSHSGYVCTHKHLTQDLYIHNLLKQLHDFIRYCPQCQLNQTPQHTLYELMQSILSLLQPFYTITLNFILGLSTSLEGFNNIMSVTDKFSKAVTFILDKITWGEKKWAVQLLARLDLLEWSLSNTIISDCNVKFVTGLWRAIFEHLHIDLFYSTVYHSQTNSVSEVTNQQAEITLQYYLMTMNDLVKWSVILSQLQAALNNIYWTSTCQTLNKVLYDFCSNEVLNLLQTNISERSTSAITAASTEHDHDTVIAHEALRSNHDLITIIEAHSMTEECTTERIRLWENQKKDLLAIMSSYWPSHINTKDAITWAVMQVKHYYDVNHHPQFFTVRGEVLLHLHCSYKLSEIMNWKLKWQFIELFKVTEWIECLTYCLDLPSVWKIHNVISIAHLELISTNDPYNWAWPTNLSAVTVDSAEAENHYKIERLLQKWVSCWGCGHITEYLIHWKSYESEHDIWYNVKNLREVKELVSEYEEHTAREQEAILS